MSKEKSDVSSMEVDDQISTNPKFVLDACQDTTLIILMVATAASLALGIKTERLHEKWEMAMEGRSLEKERDIDDLPKNEANYIALTPLWFLKQAALVHPHHRSVVHGSVQYTWLQTYQRCCRLASALSNHSVGFGSTVAVIAPNILAMYEAHFGVPMSGAVINAVNICSAPFLICFGSYP
ncbi:hypothetical protein L2E82_50184 [Cichorium intybus]|nr:hypothetical protein L2E82_50184 [Cichorium intybus]